MLLFSSVSSAGRPAVRGITASGGGTTRNNYDRIAHFAIGLNSYMLAELFLRKRWVSGRVTASVFAVVSIVAMAGLWEIVEWIGAVWDGGDAGLAFLGSQGDVWDAQKDMLADSRRRQE